MKQSDIYIGKKIAEIMAEKEVTKAELARRLEIRPQSVDYMLTRKSIDTDTLLCVSKALDYDFAQLYSIKTNQTKSDDDKNELDVQIKSAKVILEIELGKDDFAHLNLKNRISALFDK